MAKVGHVSVSLSAPLSRGGAVGLVAVRGGVLAAGRSLGAGAPSQQGHGWWTRIDEPPGCVCPEEEVLLSGVRARDRAPEDVRFQMQLAPALLGEGQRPVKGA